ncbi:hypothetical protein KTC96_24830 (plasmid) [Clostridium estertheticum]|uniref:hypothetical protein n=1 Tax=Clostridium estertheticum TaxID=238834 RepID=UPI001C7D1547|nr:hypothetical protein [Clostridium estertheticum]MBX4259754.1 hypothetical protein [Clostridium estertheticum]WLC73249.1 hypothetical protein KTC96_24830 [Clostridium estertheticum]
MQDFWGFKDARSLQKDVANMPDTILKEQVALLSDKTGGELYGKVTNCKVTKQDIEYEMASIFDIIVPRLDNYSTTILTMYSHPESEYPIAITVGSKYISDLEDFEPKYECNNKEDFENHIRQILTSKDVLNKVRVLFSKATII